MPSKGKFGWCDFCNRMRERVKNRRCHSCAMKAWRKKNPEKHKAIERRYYLKKHTPRLPMPERFFVKVNKDAPNGCWEWTAGKDGSDKGGYGQFFYKGKARRAHIISYILAGRAIPKGLELDHLCRNRKCVNPDHLEPVTRKVNVQRGDTWASGARNRNKTHCKYGHKYTKENTYVYNGSRTCRACGRAYAARRRKLKEAEGPKRVSSG